MVRILNWIKGHVGVEVDKQLHFIVGVAIAALMVAVGLGLYAGAATTIAGVGKEIYDGKHSEKHTKDWNDAIYTAVPGVLVSLAYFAMA